MTTETTALTVQHRAAVALSSSKAEAELIELAGKSKSITAITNADGRKECHAAAMVAKEARIAVEKAAKAAREDATAFSKAVIAEEKRLVDLIAPEECRLIALRDDWDAKVKAEKEAKEAAERARVAAIRKKIDDLKANAINVTSGVFDVAGVALVIEMVEAAQIDDSFGEFYGEAMEAKGDTLAKLREIHASKRQAEAEAARIKAEQEAEAERLRQEREELARMRAEQDRIEAEAKAKREEEDRKAREAMEAQAAELKRQQEELDRQRRELEAAKQKEQEAERAAQQQAAQVIEAAQAEKAADDAAAAKCIAPIIAAEIAARQEGPAATMKLGEINAALGVVSITADQLAALGFKPHTTDKSAKLYLASHFPLICAALVRHITAVANAPMKLAA